MTVVYYWPPSARKKVGLNANALLVDISTYTYTHMHTCSYGLWVMGMVGWHRQWCAGQLTAVVNEILRYAIAITTTIYNKFKGRNLRLIGDPTNYGGAVNKRVCSE